MFTAFTVFFLSRVPSSSCIGPVTSCLYRKARGHAAMTADITRLHISPLTPALLDSILAPSVRPLATDISFHTIPTFPENSYGYISLPSMEADKLKKKLNGSFLKGRKMKVEVARPPPQRTKDTEEDSAGDTKSTPQKNSKKRKAEDGVLEGYELPADRKVKRGWTEPASVKKDKRLRKADKNSEKEGKKPKAQAKSKYSDKAECLFRTKTPPNRLPPESVGKKKKSKKGKSPNEVVVHEFAKSTTHPTFVKSGEDGKKVTAEYVEGKGWVDEDGNVKDPVSDKITKPTYQPGKKDGAKELVSLKKVESPSTSKKRKKSPVPEEDSSTEETSEDSESDWTSSSGITDDESESESDEEEDTTSSDTSSDDEDESESESSAESFSDESESQESETMSAKPEKADEAAADESDSSSSVEGSDEPKAATEQKEVHPLEALFKRPASSEKNKPESGVDSEFTFFGGNDDEDEEDTGGAVEPLTPFTKQDLQSRGVRSGAPTPDTALANRTSIWNQASDEEMEDVDGDEAGTTPSKTRESGPGKPEESEFAKWFWEHRGENNRAWKRRRREAAKEKRQQENRRKGLKGRS